MQNNKNKNTHLTVVETSYYRSGSIAFTVGFMYYSAKPVNLQNKNKNIYQNHHNRKHFSSNK